MIAFPIFTGFVICKVIKAIPDKALLQVVKSIDQKAQRPGDYLTLDYAGHTVNFNSSLPESFYLNLQPQ